MLTPSAANETNIGDKKPSCAKATEDKNKQMKTVSISGSPRANVGKKDARALRREGKVPCVLYGGKEQVSFFVPEKDFKKLVYSPDVHLVNLDVSGKKFDAVMQEIQFHPVTDKISHIDFLEVVPGKPVIMDIPVKCKGIPAGVKEGGKLQQKMRTIKVRGLIEKMPPAIELEVTKMNLGDVIKVNDLKYDGLTFIAQPEVTVVAVRFTRQVVEEVAPVAATTAAPAAGATTAAAGATSAAAGDAKKDEKAAPKKDEKKK
jgi:large subunit ribosomal protein L25